MLVVGGDISVISGIHSVHSRNPIPMLIVAGNWLPCSSSCCRHQLALPSLPPSAINNGSGNAHPLTGRSPDNLINCTPTERVGAHDKRPASAKVGDNYIITIV